jgi:enediyne biosynthesis protein E4
MRGETMGSTAPARLVGIACLVASACVDPRELAEPGASTTAAEAGTSTSTSTPVATSADLGSTTLSPPAPADETSTGEPPPDVGGPPPVDPPPGFTVVTEAAGLAIDPGDFAIAPFCLLDDVEKPNSAGDFCIPERFLGAVAVADYDEDGWPDLYLTTLRGPDRLMRNRGDGTFEDVAAAAGLVSAHVTGGAAWADVDGDGDLDLVRTSIGSSRNVLHINDGTGVFTEEAVARGLAVDTGAVHVGMDIGVGDYDLDGWLDVFVSDWHPDDPLGNSIDHNRLLRGLGASGAPGSFEDVTEAMGIDLRALAPIVDAKAGSYGFAPAFVDLDDDGWPELTLAADFGTSRLWWNEGGVAFSDLTFASGVGTERNGMGSTFGDYDGDGDLDWFVSAIATPELPWLGNRMYRNEGGRQLLDVTDLLGLRDGGWAWGTAFMDLEHDGDLDLVLTAGWPSTSFHADPVRIWRNDDPLAPWPDRAMALGVAFARQGRGLVPFDYDRDGDLDLLVVSNTELPALYRNDMASGHWLVVEIEGLPPNTRALGAKVRVQAVAGGPWQVRQIGVGSHFFGQQEFAAHFGLGDAASVHRVEVHWPATGQTQVLEGVARDQRLRVVE